MRKGRRRVVVRPVPEGTRVGDRYLLGGTRPASVVKVRRRTMVVVPMRFYESWLYNLRAALRWPQRPVIRYPGVELSAVPPARNRGSESEH